MRKLTVLLEDDSLVPKPVIREIVNLDVFLEKDGMTLDEVATYLVNRAVTGLEEYKANPEGFFE